tara:strand:+ start:1288 stop:1446 length:159 start_codon:yes stop_codon:yes gene_type:complete
MCSFPAHSIVDPSGSFRVLFTRRVNTQCDRDDALFIFVSPMTRCCQGSRVII